MARRSGHPGDAVRSTNQDRTRSGGSTSRGAGQTGRFGAADNKDQPGAYPPSPVPRPSAGLLPRRRPHRPPQVTSDGIIGASPLCRPPGSRPPRHRALATDPRQAARRSGDRPARPPKTHPHSCPPSRWPPQAHRRPGYGTRTSRPRRPSSEVGHRQADAGRSSLRPPAHIGPPQPQRADPNAGRAVRTRECFGERSRWSARTTPAQTLGRRVRVQGASYRSTLSNDRWPSRAVGPDAGTVALPDGYTVAGGAPLRPTVPDRTLRHLRPVPQPTTSGTDRAGGQA